MLKRNHAKQERQTLREGEGISFLTFRAAPAAPAPGASGPASVRRSSTHHKHRLKRLAVSCHQPAQGWQRRERNHAQRGEARAGRPAPAAASVATRRWPKPACRQAGAHRRAGGAGRRPAPEQISG